MFPKHKNLLRHIRNRIKVRIYRKRVQIIVLATWLRLRVRFENENRTMIKSCRFGKLAPVLSTVSQSWGGKHELRRG